VSRSDVHDRNSRATARVWPLAEPGTRPHDAATAALTVKQGTEPWMTSRRVSGPTWWEESPGHDSVWVWTNSQSKLMAARLMHSHDVPGADTGRIPVISRAKRGVWRTAGGGVERTPSVRAAINSSAST
jgi:hypothetical protein